MGKWLEAYQGIVPPGGLDCLYGCRYWKSLFQGCIPDGQLDARFNVPRAHAFLLYGPAGNGKRALALAFAKELFEAGYGFVHVPGMALAEAPGGIEELFEEILSETTGQGKAGFCLFFDWLGELAGQEEAMWVLSQYICMLKERDIPSAVLATVEDLQDVHPLLKKSMLPCGIGLPDEKERGICLEQMFGDRVLLAPGLGYKAMAKMTEGFTYGRLCDLHRVAHILLKQKAREFCGGDGKRLEEILQKGYVVLTEEMFANMAGQLRVRHMPGSKEQAWDMAEPETAFAGNPERMQSRFEGAGLAGNPEDPAEEGPAGFAAGDKDFISRMMEMDLGDL